MAGYIRIEKYSRLARRFLPKPGKDFFRDDESLVPRNGTTAFSLTCRIPYAGVRIEAVPKTFDLPDFLDALLTYHLGTLSSSYEEIDVWDSVRMQLRATQDEELILPPQTVKACPHGPRSGLCNFVLVKDGPDGYCSGIRGKLSMKARCLT